MLKKTITYVDFDGNERTEDHYFNLTMAELTKLFSSVDGGLDKYLKEVMAAKSSKRIIEMLDKVFPGTYDPCRMSGLPFVYCGTIVLVLLPCYFFSKKIRGRDRIAGAAIIIVLCVSMYIKQVDMLWHGGQLPNWLPNRYSFMLSFMLTVMAAQAFDGRKEIPKKYITLSALFCSRLAKSVLQPGLLCSVAATIRRPESRKNCKASCMFVTLRPTSNANAVPLDPQALFLLVEGLDPLCVICADASTADLFGLAYRTQYNLDSAARVFGRPAVMFDNLDSSLATEAGKQRVWHLLKSLPKR